MYKLILFGTFFLPKQTLTHFYTRTRLSRCPKIRARKGRERISERRKNGSGKEEEEEEKRKREERT